MMLMTCWILATLPPAPSSGNGQDVRSTSYVTSTGERVLRLEVTLPVGAAQAWKLFTTEEGWKKWATPVVSMDFKTGGQIRSHYDKTKSIGDAGTIHLPIVNYLEGELLTLKVILNDSSFDPKVRQESHNLQEIIQFVELAPGKTRIVSSMIGWGNGPEWDQCYDFFARGNEWTYKQLSRVCSGAAQNPSGN